MIEDFINLVCYTDFSSKNIMESNGWVFHWNDVYVFRPGGQYCDDVPSASYCGFRGQGDGKISYKFSSSGTGTLSYGSGWEHGSVNVYMNDKELESKTTGGTSNLTIIYSPGDVLKIVEVGQAILIIHSLCISSAPSSGIYN